MLNFAIVIIYCTYYLLHYYITSLLSNYVYMLAMFIHTHTIGIIVFARLALFIFTTVIALSPFSIHIAVVLLIRNVQRTKMDYNQPVTE